MTQGADKTVPEGCAEFIDEQVLRIIDKHPDMVITTSTRAGYTDTDPEYLDPGWTPTVKKFTNAGVPVFAIRDTPRMDRRGAVAAPDCLAEEPNDVAQCYVPRSDVFDPVSPTDEIKDQLPNVIFADFSDYFCNTDKCPAVIGNVLVYKDGNHVTATYAKTLTPMIEKAFLAATGWSGT
ncbi:SGNH hydrolase domain-containing protein [Arthrobacter sp. SA17]